MKLKLLIFIFALGLLSSCQKPVPADTFSTVKDTPSPIKNGMIKVSILYPAGEGKTFDMNYYVTKHMPLVKELLGDSLKALGIDKPISGRGPNDPAPYMAIGHLYFETVAAYQNSMAPHRERIVGDIPNYTNITPTIQISEVLE